MNGCQNSLIGSSKYWKEQEYTSILDGQASMIEDCFEELKKQGRGVISYKEKVRKFVKAFL